MTRWRLPLGSAARWSGVRGNPCRGLLELLGLKQGGTAAALCGGHAAPHHAVHRRPGGHREGWCSGTKVGPVQQPGEARTVPGLPVLPVCLKMGSVLNFPFPVLNCDKQLEFPTDGNIVLDQLSLGREHMLCAALLQAAQWNSWLRHESTIVNWTRMHN